jgi:uncharacterized protein YjcR
MAKKYTEEQKNEAMLMYTVKGMMLKEIASKTNIPVGTLQQWQNRGRWQLLRVEKKDLEYAEAAIQYIHESIKTYALFRELVHKRVEKEGPTLQARDMKALIEIVQIADNKILEYYAITGVSNEA